MFGKIRVMENRDKKYFMKDGKGYVVRFFECEDSRDLRDLIQIVESSEVQRWMDNVDNLNIWNYQKWMDEKGEGNTFLFAIADLPEEVANRRVHGFIYFYPSKIVQGRLEMSYAKRPGAPAGLITPAIEIGCKLVFEYLQEKKPWMTDGLKVLAEIESGNIPSIKVAEKAGFKMIRGFDLENNGLWERDLVMDKEVVVEEVLEKKMTIDSLPRVRQENPAFCGPATLQILLSHYGIETSQDKLVESATTRELALKNGMSIELLATAVKNSYPGMRLWAKRDASLFDIEQMVRVYNYPVGVDWQGIFGSDSYEDYPDEEGEEMEDEEEMCKGDSGHYCVVTDVDRANDSIRMMDPYGHYHAEDRVYMIQQFLNRWWDDRVDKLPDGSKKYVYEKRLMFVVVPKNVRIPEALGMTEL